MRSYFKESLYVLTFLKTNTENSDEFCNIGEDAWMSSFLKGKTNNKKIRNRNQKDLAAFSVT